MAKKKPNYFQITSPRVNKLFLALFSILATMAVFISAMAIVALISQYVSKPGMDIASLFEWYNMFLELLMTIFVVVFLAFASVVVYNYITNVEKANAEKRTIDAQSPLLGRAKEHEEQIINLLTTIAHPLPGKAKLNRARTAQFLCAMMELGYIDKNTDEKILMAWVETVTEFKDGNLGHFKRAIKDVPLQDPKVEDLRKQIEQMVNK